MSIVSAGIGTPMLDFAIREGKFVVDGPMAMIRFGLCSSISEDVSVGDTVIHDQGCFMIQTDFDVFNKKSKDDPYIISSVV